MPIPKNEEMTMLDTLAIELAKGRMGAHVPDSDRLEHAKHAYRDAAALLAVRDEMHAQIGARLDQLAAQKKG